MKHYSRNILVFAESCTNMNGFNVYLDFSGQREYLFTHRRNNAMYGVLKNGIRLADLARGTRDMSLANLYGRAAQQLRSSMRWLLVVIDEYIEDREQCA